MFSLLRMDLYRMYKSTSFRVCMAVIVGMILFAVAMVWAVSNIQVTGSENTGVIISSTNDDGSISFNGELDESDIADIEEAGSFMTNVDILSYLGELGISGELVGVIIAIFAALFIGGEFESGYAKNVFSVAKNRRSYFASKSVALLIAATAFFLTAVIVALLAGLIAGFGFVGVPIGELLAWMGIAIVSFWALSMLVALFCWLAKTKTAGLLIGIFVSIGFVGGMLGAIVSYIPGIEFLKEWMLYTNWSVLTTGLSSLAITDIIQMTCVGFGYLVLYSLLGMVVLQKKDI